MKHRNETDPEKIKMLIARGEYVIKEVEALYMLRKYRTLKQRYYQDESKWQRRVLNSKLQDYLLVWRNQSGLPTSAVVKGLRKMCVVVKLSQTSWVATSKRFCVCTIFYIIFIYKQSVIFPNPKKVSGSLHSYLSVSQTLKATF